MNRPLQFAVIALAILAGIVTAYLLKREPPPAALLHATLFEAPRPMPAMRLTDHRGQPYGAERLRGRWTFLFFGFTNCPDICPTTLATLAAVRAGLADLPASERPEVVLVSVDPARDTPEILARYVAHFDPTFTGLTGDTAAIEALTRELGIAVVIGAPDTHGAYTVDHTAAILLVDADAAWTAVFGTPHRAETIAADYRAIIDRRAR
ncbi:MAG: SCO family protein [Pseudomonadota bacterium]|nr:SCO family protein [Pseudomonadota bacterium]